MQVPRALPYDYGVSRLYMGCWYRAASFAATHIPLGMHDIVPDARGGSGATAACGLPGWVCLGGLIVHSPANQP